jgi:hypothetical protein
VLVWECAVLSLPKESPHRLGVRASKLCWSRPSDPLDSRGGHGGYRSVLRRGAEPMNDMSDDSGSENSGNGFRADPAPTPVDLANGDLSPHKQPSRSSAKHVVAGDRERVDGETYMMGLSCIIGVAATSPARIWTEFWVTHCSIVQCDHVIGEWQCCKQDKPLDGGGVVHFCAAAAAGACT